VSWVLDVWLRLLGGLRDFDGLDLMLLWSLNGCLGMDTLLYVVLFGIGGLLVFWVKISIIGFSA
jgi:hypothetical protein